MSSNDYFDNPTDHAALPKGSTARAESVDAKFDAITTGLDKLPTENEFKRGTKNYGDVSTGSAGAYAVTIGHITAYSDGQEIEFKANHASPSGGITIDVDSVGATAGVWPNDTSIADGDIPLNATVRFVYNSTLVKWVLMSTVTSSAAEAAAAAASAAELSGYTALTFSGTTAFNLNGNQTQFMSVTGNLSTLTTSNRTAGRSITVLLTASGGARTITYNASWVQIGSLPTSIPSGKTLLLSFVCKGTAETDVFVTGAIEI